MIAEVGSVVKVESLEDVKVELRDYLDTYAKQLEGMCATFAWAKPRLTGEQRQEWERTIESLKTVCRALDAGFEPINPPRNWSSGLLNQYMAPIPEAVREKIDRAIPVFGLQRLLIYDPNEERFSRPKHTDPLAVGYCDLAQQRLHFLVGQWDLAADLKFIKGERRDRTVRTTMRRLTEVTSIRPLQVGRWGSGAIPYIAIPSITTAGDTNGTGGWVNMSQSASARVASTDTWVANMTSLSTR